MGESDEAGCPSCGAQLLVVESEYAPAPPAIPASRTATPSEREPLESAEPEAVVEPAVHAARSHRRAFSSVWLILPILIVLGVAASALVDGGSHGPRRASGSAAPVRTLPHVLAYITEGPLGGTGTSLYMGDGWGRNAYVALGGDEPLTFEFDWTENGRHSSVLDAGGTLHILPEDKVLDIPVRSAAFAPNGQLIAACSGAGWPPRIVVVPAAAPSHPLWPVGVAGCAPRWSADSGYVAFRIPSVDSPAALYDPVRIGVWNVRVNRVFAVDARWPVTWAPAAGFAITPLTVTSISGDEVEVMDQRGGRRHTIVSSATIRGLTGGLQPGPIVMMAWSPPGDRLAVAFAPGPGTSAGVLEIDPRTGVGNFVGSSLFPVALAWSSQDRLLATFAGEAPSGSGLRVQTDLVDPGSATVLGSVRDASWSGDGRWILGRIGERWFVIDPTDPARRYPYGRRSSGWVVARWCCPALPVVDLGGLPGPG
jgi:hypothetical protein